MRISTVLAVGVATIAIAGCAPRPPAKALPQDFMNKVMEASFAATIADECGYIRFNRPYQEQVFKAEITKLAYKGYTKHDLDTAAKRMRTDPSVRRRAQKMVDDRKIDVYSERSWCRAGDREMARKTAIGRYLF